MPGRIALAVLASLYALAVLVASIHPGPRAWGIHLPGFLSAPWSWITLALLLAGAAALTLPVPTSSTQTRKRTSSSRGAKRSARPLPLWITLLPVYGILLYVLRVRTYFLGDGIVWLHSLLGGETQPYSEPLAADAWSGFTLLLKALGLPREPSTFALLPVACGIAAAALARGIIAETIRSPRVRWVAWGLFLTASFTQIYYGYLESYPIASVAILGYLLLALRHARGAGPPWLLGVALAVTVASHLATAFLFPSYVVAVLRRPGPSRWRAALILFPLAVAPFLIAAAGARPTHPDWLEPLRIAARSSPFSRHERYLSRPYGLFSLAHAGDIANAMLLAIPVPALLLAAWLLARRGSIRPASPATEVLAAAAASGTLLLAALALPVAPAQDWDLSATLVLPMGVAGIVAGRGFYENRRRAGALLALSLGSLLAFVLVNASEPAALVRMKTLIRPDARLSLYGRGYAASMLSEFYEDRAAQESSLVYANVALQSESTNPRYWLRVGTILFNQGRYDAALPKLQQSASRGPGRADCHNNLGLCLAKMGRTQEAVSQFHAAAFLDPSRPEHFHNLGLMLYETGKADSARMVWTGVLRRWPGYLLTARSMAKRFGDASTTP